ncbi:hypothetical protein WA158_005306 [Blastocystis sp. Blastoise]
MLSINVYKTTKDTKAFEGTTYSIEDIQKDFSIGESIHCRCHLLNTRFDAVQCPLNLPMGKHGMLYINDYSNSKEWKNKSMSVLKNNDLLSVHIIGKEQHNNETIYICSKRTDNYSPIKVNNTIYGYVCGTSDKGLFLRLDNNQYTGHVFYHDASDKYEKKIKSKFYLGELVLGKIMNIKEDMKSCDISLKKSDMDPSLKPLTFDDLKVNQIISGKVKNITDFGLFVRIKNSKLDGLCHITECADINVKDIHTIYKLNDEVKALIIKLNSNTKKISLSLKASKINKIELNKENEKEKEIVEEESSEEESSEEEDGFKLLSKNAVKKQEIKDIDEDIDDEEDSDKDLLMDIESDNNEESEEEEEEEEEEEMNNNLFNIDNGLSSAFEWSDFISHPTEDNNNKMEIEEDKEEEEEDNKKDIKKENRKYKNEKLVSEREMLLANNNILPESEADFERLLLGNPSSSHIYIRYASWLISVTEVTKARAILKRGLESIPFRLEEEKLNIWYALLNLESEYGDENSLEKTYKEAKEHMNDKLIRLHMVHIYENQEKVDKAMDLWKEICKKSNNDVDCWLGYCNCCYLLYTKEQGSKKAGELLKQSLLLLPSNNKVRMLSGYGVILYKYDSYDKARTIFEDLISKYPKRLDLWYIYIDQEIKKNNLQYVRSLYTRLIEVKLNVNRIKSIFKRWISFEEDKGDEEHVTFVENKVKEYIQKLQE